jgi:hypothetical protein
MIRRAVCARVRRRTVPSNQALLMITPSPKPRLPWWRRACSTLVHPGIKAEPPVTSHRIHCDNLGVNPAILLGGHLYVDRCEFYRQSPNICRKGRCVDRSYGKLSFVRCTHGAVLTVDKPHVRRHRPIGQATQGAIAIHDELSEIFRKRAEWQPEPRRDLLPSSRDRHSAWPQCARYPAVGRFDC